MREDTDFKGDAGPKAELIQRGWLLPADTYTPVSAFMAAVGDAPGILLESAEVDGRWGRYSLVAWDFILTARNIQGRLGLEIKDHRLKDLESLDGQEFVRGLRELLRGITLLPEKGLEHLPPITRALYGYIEYELAQALEPALAGRMPPGSPGTTLVLPAKLMLLDHLHRNMWVLSLNRDPQISLPPLPLDHPSSLGIRETRVVPGKEEFLEMARGIRELIISGDAIQVVLSVRFQADYTGDPFAGYRNLARINPSPYTFFMRFDPITLLGSSPELMIRCQNRRLYLRPIAGTKPRGEDTQEDDDLAREMVSDPKEKAEHIMLVDLGRNDLGKVAEPGSVRVNKLMQVERFSHVMHMTSYLSAQARAGLDLVDVLAATFPAGTVTGAPKIRAMEIIAEHEAGGRGPYGGAVGWLGLDKNGLNMDMGITIRSAWFDGSTVFWQAGAGIVADSVPEREWEECNNKARVLVEALKQEDENAFGDR